PDVAVSGKVIIPSSHDGKPVTGVASFGFESRQDLTSVFLPDSITNIGGEAFAVDKNLQRIRFSENLKTIGKEAFLGCMSLGKIIFPESLRDVYDRAFFGCQLKEIYFQGNAYVGNDVFYGNAIDHFTVSPNGHVLSDSSFDYFIGNTPMPIICPSTAFYSDTADNRPLQGVIYTDAKTIPANWRVIKDGLFDELPSNPIFLNCTFEGVGADMYLTSLTHTRIEYSPDFSHGGAVDCGPYRKGYTFVGWTTKKGDTKVEYTMEQLLSKTPPYNWPYEYSPVSQPIVPYGTTLYPIWEEIKTYDK
ncbi:MAG: leucine-rich repeat protein, partial [Clostridia bacterium]|nr:leucine-rich repeat protein [Clostridia bacterium]